MKVVGLFYGAGYALINADGNGGAGRGFDYNEWNNSRQYNLKNFTGSLQNEMGTGNIADLMAYNEIARLQVAAEMPGARVVGMEDELSERRRLNQLKQAALQPRKNLGPFKPLEYEIVNAGSLKRRDEQGQIKMERLYRLKIEYGYRIIDEKKAYHQNMHQLALDVLQNATAKMMHLGNFEREWLNAKISADDLQMEFLSSYRLGGSLEYRRIDLRDDGVYYNRSYAHRIKQALFGGTLKGLVVGPRISVVSTKPMTEERVKNLMSILGMKGSQDTFERENN